MIITRAPFRISFVGGGSDMPSFYTHCPGAVLSVSIDKYVYISSHKYFDPKQLLIKYSKTELVSAWDAIQHPIYKEAFKQFQMNGGLEINSFADIPSGTGLGSSSAFTVAVLLNLFTRQSQFIDQETLANNACEIEIDRLKEPIGKQDQYASAVGGLNTLMFNKNRSVGVSPIHLNETTYKTLENNLLLFYTGKQRSASTILRDQNKGLQDEQKFNTLKKMTELIPALEKSLYANDLDSFGDILNENWQLKKQLSTQISDASIDELYQLGLSNGARGGKLLGAGGGGFLLFYCDEKYQAKLRAAFERYQELPFHFENDGAKIIHISNEYR